MPLFPDTSNVPDLVIAEPGEYNLRITAVKSKTSQNEEAKYPGREMLMVTFEIEDLPNSQPIFHHVLFPHPDEPEENQNRWLRDIKAFKQAFGFSDDDNPDVEDLIGQVGPAILGIEEYNGEETNRVKRFMA